MPSPVTLPEKKKRPSVALKMARELVLYKRVINPFNDLLMKHLQSCISAIGQLCIPW
jgi:hypothetical protein